MLPKTHFLSGAVLSLIAYLLFPPIGLNALFILLGSFIFDLDHLFVYASFKKSINPIGAYKFYKKVIQSKKFRKKYPVQDSLYIFHTIEFYLLLFALGFLNYSFFLLFGGLALHSFLDSLNRLDKKHFSLIGYLLQNRKKSEAKSKKKSKVKKRKTSIYAILLLIFCTLLTSSGQIFFKLGSETAAFDLSLIANYNLIAGVVLYASAAFLLIIALRHGELSILYPIIATSYIWVSLLSLFYLKEPVGIYSWIGIASIFIGVSLIGGGSRR